MTTKHSIETADALQTTTITDAPASERERLIMEHLPQVRLIARRIYDRLPGCVHLEDLVSTGVVGLISAIDRYNSDQGVKLRTYAEYKIRGAILDSLRGLDWTPRRQRRRARAIEAAVSALEQKAHGTPSDADVAAELGISLEEYREWTAKSATTAWSSLDATVSDDDGKQTLRHVAATDEILPSEAIESSELQALLARALDRMPQPERTVLSLYYHEELTLREISRVMGLHESRVSQLKLQALGRLRTLMGKQWPQRGAQVEARPGHATATRASFAQ